MSWYKILKMQKVDVIYIYISFGDRRRTFSLPNRLKNNNNNKWRQNVSPPKIQ